MRGRRTARSVDLPLETSQPNCSAGRVDHFGRPATFGAFSAKNPERFLKDFRFYGGPILFCIAPGRLRHPIIDAATFHAVFGLPRQSRSAAGILAAPMRPQQTMNCHGLFCQK